MTFFNKYSNHKIVYLPRTDMEPENPQHQIYIANLIESLIQEIDTKAATLNQEELFLAKLKLMEAAKTFRVSWNIFFYLFL